jgi:hypothetical protein
MKIVVNHAPWAKGRPETLARLLEQLGPSADVLVIPSRRVEHSSSWARKTWEFVEDQKGPVITLEDDVEVAPGFVAACEAVSSLAPDEAISLHTQVPEAVQCAAEGHRWCRCYWLSGPASILPPWVAASLLDYAAAIPQGVLAHMNHDNVTMHWAWARQRPFLATIPALAHHDTGVPSTLGYDDHPNRVPHVPLCNFPDARPADPAWWGSPATAPTAPTVANPWASPQYLETVRAALRGPGLCTMCLSSPAAVRSSNGTALCSNCVRAATLAATGGGL